MVKSKSALKKAERWKPKFGVFEISYYSMISSTTPHKDVLPHSSVKKGTSMDAFPEYQSQEHESHQCDSHRDGDWIIFTCPKCLSYERRMNWRTGQMKVKEGENPHILHAGDYFPEEYRYSFTSIN